MQRALLTYKAHRSSEWKKSRIHLWVFWLSSVLFTVTCNHHDRVTVSLICRLAVAKHWNSRYFTNLLKRKYIFRERDSCAHRLKGGPDSFYSLFLYLWGGSEWRPDFSCCSPSAQGLSIFLSLCGAYLIWFGSGRISYLHGKHIT